MIHGTAPLTPAEADLVKKCLPLPEAQPEGMGALGLPPNVLLYLAAAGGVLLLYLALKKKR